jgi:ubiquinone biosynthesis protein COQ4
VRAHLYETHDFWHVMTGFDTDVAGEVGLQAFYLAQFPARLAAVLIGLMFLNTFLYRFDDRDRRMDAMVRGWKLGRDARPLFGVRWDTMWSTPLADVRAQYRLC